jgi:hypothetical protein
VQAFPPSPSSSRAKWQISQNGGQEMRWRGDGRELFWNTSDGKIWAADIETSARGVRSGTPRELFAAPIYTATSGSFDVTPDGQRFLLLLFASRRGIDPVERGVQLADRIAEIARPWDGILARRKLTLS